MSDTSQITRTKKESFYYCIKCEKPHYSYQKIYKKHIAYVPIFGGIHIAK